MLPESAQWLRERCREALSVPAIYRPRDGGEREVRAVLGGTVFEARDDYGIATRTETRDFLVSVEDMPDEPERGDCFLLDASRYEVLSAKGEPCWRWSDPYRLVRRIHTKEIANEKENPHG